MRANSTRTKPGSEGKKISAPEPLFLFPCMHLQKNERDLLSSV